MASNAASKARSVNALTAHEWHKIIVMIMVSSILLTLFVIFMVRWIGGDFAKSDRVNYDYLSFDVYSAADVCESAMIEKLGSELLRFHIDEHSSRVDTSQGIYRVYFKADVGKLNDYNEVTVYCYVDKWDHKLSYQRVIDPSKRQVTYKDINFFQN